MKKIPKFVWVMVVLAGIFVAAQVAWNAAYPSGTFRYKMTVTVETPEGIKTGSAVREVHAHVEPRLFPEQGGGGYFHVVRGEAVVVDLGARGVLFALMRGGPHGVDYAERILFDAFPFRAPMTKEGVEYYLSLKHGQKVTLPSNKYPMFVRFRDIKNPKTVEAISSTIEKDQPYGVSGNVMKAFSTIYGDAVKIKSADIEITDEPVTWNIDEWLPWLAHVKMSYLSGLHINGPSLYESLDGGGFQKGDRE